MQLPKELVRDMQDTFDEFHAAKNRLSTRSLEICQEHIDALVDLVRERSSDLLVRYYSNPTSVSDPRARVLETAMEVVAELQQHFIFEDTEDDPEIYETLLTRMHGSNNEWAEFFLEIVNRVLPKGGDGEDPVPSSNPSPSTFHSGDT